MLAAPQNSPLSLALDEIAEHEVGGKAAGLAELSAMGLSVPPAFVIINAQADLLPDDLLQRYADIGGGKVAVRSSAIGEDGEQSSFAGLYETILNVTGIDALRSAIDQCLASLASDRADAYRSQSGNDETELKNERDRSLFLQIELKGLFGIGDTIENILDESIFGYKSKSGNQFHSTGSSLTTF